MQCCKSGILIIPQVKCIKGRPDVVVHILNHDTQVRERKVVSGTEVHVCHPYTPAGERETKRPGAVVHIYKHDNHAGERQQGMAGSVLHICNPDTL